VIADSGKQGRQKAMALPPDLSKKRDNGGKGVFSITASSEFYGLL